MEYIHGGWFVDEAVCLFVCSHRSVLLLFVAAELMARMQPSLSHHGLRLFQENHTGRKIPKEPLSLSLRMSG